MSIRSKTEFNINNHIINTWLRPFSYSHIYTLSTLPCWGRYLPLVSPFPTVSCFLYQSVMYLDVYKPVNEIVNFYLVRPDMLVRGLVYLQQGDDYFNSKLFMALLITLLEILTKFEKTSYYLGLFSDSLAHYLEIVIRYLEGVINLLSLTHSRICRCF